MLTHRDKQIIKSIGDHRILSQQQIINLYFPGEYGYWSLWRRYDRELKENNYINDDPFYIEVNSSGKRVALYRLEKAGKSLYKEMTGKEYNTPSWNLMYIPHLLEVNNFLINMGIKDFKLEYKIDNVKMDAYFNDTSLEVDLSEGEPRFEIQKQYKSYEKLYKKRSMPQNIIWYSNRAKKLKKWINEVKTTNISLYYVRRNKNSLQKFKSNFNLKQTKTANSSIK